MATHDTERNPDAIEALRPRFRLGYRFNPHLLILLAGLAAFALVAFRAVETAIHVVYASTYRQADWRMDEARPNDGAPYVTGTLLESGEEVLVAARRNGQRFLVGSEGDEAFEPGKVVKLWWSASAPDLTLQGRRTNAIPVWTMPERPGIGLLMLQLIGMVVVLAATFKLTAFVSRWSRRGIVTSRP